MPHNPHKLINCKNCGSSFHGHYCNQCGQDAHTGKIDKHFLYHEIQHGLLHIDKGILYTVRELFTHPGQAIRLFIQGKRVRHFKPLAFVIVIAGLYTFVNHYFNTGLTLGRPQDQTAASAVEKYNDFTKTHYAIYVLLQLPVLAWVCYRVFKKYGTNYMEQLVINTYLAGQRIIVRLALIPLSYLIIENKHPLYYILFDLIVSSSLFMWAYGQYYNTVKSYIIRFKALLAYITNLLLIMALVSIILSLLASFPKLIA